MCLTKLIYRFTTFSTGYMTFRGKHIRVLVANTPRRMMLGLMHREHLRDNEGMLFIPGKEARHGIWMLNMRFSIDILWLSKNGKVVDIVENAKPCASMLNCRTYVPEEDALYVLEMNAGSAKRLGIRRGSGIAVGRGIS